MTTRPADGPASGAETGRRLLDAAAFARLFGGSEHQVRAWCEPYLGAFDWGYRPLTGADRDACLLQAVRRLDRQAAPVAGAGRQPDWEAGWRENLRDFQASGGDLDALVPKYIRPGEYVRLFGDYVQPVDPQFVRNYTKIFRAWLTRRFLADAAAVYEFGCGPCSHVAYFAQALPGVPICGFDWADASAEIIRAIADRYDWPVRGGRFDFLAPDPALDLAERAVVLTFGALEQVGPDHGPFLDFLLHRRPARCVHVEGLEELYDDDGLLDALALRYHRTRNYLSGFLTRLTALREDGRVVIEQVHRHQFGTRFDDTFSYVVWRPA